jgi:hypothetical protein
MQLLNSLDELLYEVMSWLIFYPVTMWRALRHPLAIMDYADTELREQGADQYTATLSPPLFLLLSVLLSHGVELALVGDSPIVRENQGLAGLISDDTSLLALRLLLFSIFPLIMSLMLVRRRKLGLNRDTLKPPFYSQCYVAAPFMLLIGIAATIAQLGQIWSPVAAVALVAAALLWFGSLQTSWFARHLAVSLPRGFLIASIAMIECVVCVSVLARLFG